MHRRSYLPESVNVASTNRRIVNRQRAHTARAKREANNTTGSQAATARNASATARESLTSRIARVIRVLNTPVSQLFRRKG